MDQAGKFVTREFVELLREPPPKDHPEVLGIRHVFHARPSEAWRIDAYIMMLTAAQKQGGARGSRG